MAERWEDMQGEIPDGEMSGVVGGMAVEHMAVCSRCGRRYSPDMRIGMTNLCPQCQQGVRGDAVNRGANAADR